MRSMPALSLLEAEGENYETKHVLHRLAFLYSFDRVYFTNFPNGASIRSKKRCWSLSLSWIWSMTALMTRRRGCKPSWAVILPI